MNKHKWKKVRRNEFACQNGCGFTKFTSTSTPFFFDSNNKTHWMRPDCVEKLKLKK